MVQAQTVDGETEKFHQKLTRISDGLLEAVSSVNIELLAAAPDMSRCPHLLRFATRSATVSIAPEGMARALIDIHLGIDDLFDLTTKIEQFANQCSGNDDTVLISHIRQAKEHVRILGCAFKDAVDMLPRGLVLKYESYDGDNTIAPILMPILVMMDQFRLLTEEY